MHRTLSLMLAVVAVIAAAGATTASGQTGAPGTLGVKITGSTVLRLEPSLFAGVRELGGRVRAGRPATATQTGVKFRVSGATIGSNGRSVVVRHSGSMRVSTRTRSVTLRNPIVTVDAATGQGQMTAAIGRFRTRIAAVQVDPARVQQSGTSLSADDVSLAMSARLARELNRVLRTDALSEGTPLGTATVRLRAGR